MVLRKNVDIEIAGLAMRDLFGTERHQNVDGNAYVDAGEAWLGNADDFEGMIVERDRLPRTP